MVMISLIIMILLVLGLSWALTCGIVYLITLCFGLTFTWGMGTGVWLCLFLLGVPFGGSKK